MEKIDKAIEILQAFKEGKTIEYQNKINHNWYKTNDITIILDYLDNNIDIIRIKPQPTYRPYANAEEFLEASKKHGGWFRKWNNRELLFTPHYKDLCNDYVWADDNTPCGILKQ